MAIQLPQLFRLRLLAAAALLFSASGAFASSLFQDGLDARSLSLGGESVAQDGSAISAVATNPAALASLTRANVEFGITGGFLRGKFERDTGEESHLRENAVLLPSFGFALPLATKIPIVIGLGFNPEIAAEVDWRYRDAGGGLGGATSYGEQRQEARILGLRSNLGVALAVTPWLSLGASAGGIYNENYLHAPYVFQSHPVLAGFKTLLDLETEGWAPGFDFGAQIHPARSVTLGLRYRPGTVVYSDGHASGNAAAQLQSLGGAFAAVDPNFRYDAEVRTKFPQIISAGGEWQALDWLRLVGGIDWVNWSDAFDRLEIRLSNGSNPAINGVAGSSSLLDIVPLNWRDQFVYRAGAECALPGGFALRAGYSYARSAVPATTMTPLNGAIFEHKVSAGAGYRTGRYHIDLAWQWALPVTQHVDRSQLLDGEYSQTSLRVSEQLIALTTGVEF